MNSVSGQEMDKSPHHFLQLFSLSLQVGGGKPADYLPRYHKRQEHREGLLYAAFIEGAFWHFIL
jgi:hypothetical protein